MLIQIVTGEVCRLGAIRLRQNGSACIVANVSTRKLVAQKSPGSEPGLGLEVALKAELGPLVLNSLGGPVRDRSKPFTGPTHIIFSILSTPVSYRLLFGALFGA